MEQFAPLVRSKDMRPIRYLVVDDSIFARKNLARMIESFGGQVAGEAGDGCTAIAEYSRTQPDIVLMDITMPQMEGIEAAERIVRQTPGRAHRHGLVGRLPGEHHRRPAEGRAALRAEAGEAGGAVRSGEVRPRRCRDARGGGRCGGS